MVSAQLLAHEITVPPETLRYILYQKTQIQHPIGKLLLRLKLTGLYESIGIPLLERPRFGSIANDFGRRCGFQFEDIEPYLPAHPSAVLDIGCGLGGVDALVNRYYASPEVKFFLLDKSGMSSDIFYGLTEEGAHYSSLDLTKLLLLANGLSEGQIELIDISSQPFPAGQKFDLIYSFISWGFHYSIEAYLEETAKALSDQGVMMLDIRKNSGGLERLQDHFSTVEVIPTKNTWSGKWDKVMVKT